MMETIFVAVMVVLTLAWGYAELRAMQYQRDDVARSLGIPQVTRAAEINLRKRPNRRFAVSYKVPRDEIHRRAQRAESETAKARREAIGQRKRADWWKSEAKRLGWKPHFTIHYR